MRRIRQLAVVLLLVIATGVIASADSRGPISILGNADFTADNGVVGGTGTQDDPYIIAGWEVDVPAGQRFGVRIENATAHFVLRGLVISGALALDGAAIRVGFVTHGTIEGCTVTNSTHGVDIVSSTDLVFRDSVLTVNGRGLSVIGETAEEYRHTIEESVELKGQAVLYYYGLDGETIDGKYGTHLTVAASRNVTISNNEIENGDGIELAFVEDSTVVGNQAYRSAGIPTTNGLLLYRSNDNLIEGNNFRNNEEAAIQLSLSNGNTIRDNELLVNDAGIRLYASDENRIEGYNVIFGNTTGILVGLGSSANVISGNIILGERTDQGINLGMATANRIEKNYFTEAEMGLVVEADATNNDIVHNSFIACVWAISNAGANNEFVGNLLSQNTRGVIFPETMSRTTTSGNVFRGNVFDTNGSHVYTNLDSQVNWFTGNVFLGDSASLVADNGTNNRWMRDGVGNYWGGVDAIDDDGDGVADAAFIVYPAGIPDTAPLATIDPMELEVGVIAEMALQTTKLELGDGTMVELPTRVADEPLERYVGFQGFPASLLAESPGILFAFEEEQELQFWMKNVPFDLDIAFFAGDGHLTGQQTMEAFSEAAHAAKDLSQYTLELPSGALADLGVDADTVLVLP